MNKAPKTEYGLEGAFKVDIYNGDGALSESTDFFNNFITTTGLYYPTTYAFADCFRFLSLGNLSSGNTMATTGLFSQPYRLGAVDRNTRITQPTQEVSYWGYNNYEKNSCGTQLEADGPVFFRAWKIPSGTNDTSADVVLREFMVSPSSGADPSGNCAFSRVTRYVKIPKGSSAVVTYRLKVRNKNSTATFFDAGTFKTGNADPESTDVCNIFNNLQGYYKHVYHGLRCIDRRGVTFIPKYGDGMEPSLRKFSSKLVCTLSPDNSQFSVNPTGGSQSNESQSYLADGLHKLTYGLQHNVADSNVEVEDVYNFSKAQLDASLPVTIANIGSAPIKNIRVRGKAPICTDFKTKTDFDYSTLAINDASPLTSSFATPGKSGYSDSALEPLAYALKSTFCENLPFDKAVQTGRKKTLTRKNYFPPVRNYGKNHRFGSFTLGFADVAEGADAEGKDTWPIIDGLFIDSSGRATQQHYRQITGVSLTSRGQNVKIAKLITNVPTLNSSFELNCIMGPVGSIESPVQGHPNILTKTAFLAEGAFPAGQVDGYYTPPKTQSNNVCDTNSAIFSAYLCSQQASPNNVPFTPAAETVENWGVVYGCISGPTTEAYSEHKLDKVTLKTSLVPNSDATIYWPRADVPEKVAVALKCKELHYYDDKLKTVPDLTAAFGASKQIIKDISFTSAGNFTSLLTGPTTYQTQGTFEGYEGIYLFSGPAPATIQEALERTVLIPLNQGKATVTPLTGYVSTTMPPSDVVGYTYAGTQPLPAGVLSSTHFFSPVIEKIAINDPTNENNVKDMFRISGWSFYKTTGLLNDASINAATISSLRPFFSGKFGGQDVTLAAIYKHSDGEYKVSSDMYSVALPSVFYPPEGKFLHKESFKLLPNHGLGASELLGHPVNAGGFYPYMDSLNSLEMYFDISWSAACGGVAGCIEPT